MLKDYQLKACEHVKQNPKSFLFMSCGTGKTLTALEASKGHKVLVLAPAKVVKAKVWEKEALKWGYEPPKVISHHKKEIDSTGFDFLIVDECHKVKNPSTQIAHRVNKMAKKIPYVLGLTGTWASNGYYDTWGMAKSMDIPMFEETTKNKFLAKYYYYYMLPNNPFLMIPTGLKDDTDIFSRIEKNSFIYVDEYDDYEEKTIIVKSDEVSQEYKDAQNHVLDGKLLTTLTKITYLRQLSNGFYYDEDGKAHDVDSVKLNAFLALYTQLKMKGRKVVIIYTFEYDRERISRVVSDGEVLIQESSAEGLNLQEYDTVIFFNPTYSYQNYEQARKRILRLGQDKTCKIITLVRENSFDEAVERRKVSKINDNDMLKEFIENEMQ